MMWIFFTQWHTINSSTHCGAGSHVMLNESSVALFPNIQYCLKMPEFPYRLLSPPTRKLFNYIALIDWLVGWSVCWLVGEGGFMCVWLCVHMEVRRISFLSFYHVNSRNWTQDIKLGYSLHKRKKTLCGIMNIKDSWNSKNPQTTHLNTWGHLTV